MNSLAPPPHVRDAMSMKWRSAIEALAILPLLTAGAVLSGAAWKLLAAQVVLMLVLSALVEAAWALVRRQRMEGRFLLYGALFALMVDRTSPGCVAAAIALGVLAGKKPLGSARLQHLHPALTAFVLLHVISPGACGGLLARNMPVGLASLWALALFLATGIRSWRPVLATFLGAVPAIALVAPFCGLSPWLSAWGPWLFAMTWFLVDPRGEPFMPAAQWVYGILCGALTALLLVPGAGGPAPVMLAALLMNAVAPVLDDIAVLRNIALRDSDVVKAIL